MSVNILKKVLIVNTIIINKFDAYSEIMPVHCVIVPLDIRMSTISRYGGGGGGLNL